MRVIFSKKNVQTDINVSVIAPPVLLSIFVSHFNIEPH
jgi:hypothetical protein